MEFNEGLLIAAKALPYVIAGASVVAKATKTEVDNKWLGRILKIIDVIAINNKPTEIVEKKEK